MKHGRISIGSLMLDLVILSVPLALLINLMNGHHVLPQDSLGDLGLWPSLLVLVFATGRVVRNRGKNSSFLVGFTVGGWGSVVAFVACCLWFPAITVLPVSLTVEKIRSCGIDWITESEPPQLYLLNLFFMGLIQAASPLMMAVIGGLIARDFWWNRWTTT